MKLEIARILRSEGYIKNFKLIQDSKQGILKIMLKYDGDQRPAILEMQRVSKPGCRVYAKVDDIPVIKKGLGVAILSTSKGVITDKMARKERVGGEVVLAVW